MMLQKIHISMADIDQRTEDFEFIRRALLELLTREPHILVRDVLENRVLGESLKLIATQVEGYFAWRRAEEELLRLANARLVKALHACRPRLTA